MGIRRCMKPSRGLLFGALLTGLFFFQPTVWAQISDTTPPVLHSLSIVPDEVDVRAGAQAATITMDFTDDLAGVAQVFISFNPVGHSQNCGPGGNVSLVAGDALNGTWQASAFFWTTCVSGDWQLYVYAHDGLNWITLSPQDLANLGFPNNVHVISNVVLDLSPPVIQDFRITPEQFDVSSGDVALMVTAHVTDAGTGISSGAVFFAPPSSTQDRSCQLRRISGTANDGVYQCLSYFFPQYSEAGIWNVNNVFFIDLGGNSANLTTAALESLGFTSSLKVSSDPSDTSAPELVDFDFSPSFVDTSSSSAALHVTAVVSDDLSGTVGGKGFVLVYFASPSGAQAVARQLVLTGGTAQLGTFEGDLVLPRFSEAGTWKASFPTLQDRVGNFGKRTSAQLEQLGFQTELIVVQPSLVTDGSASAGGGTVTDDTFGGRAQLEVPPGVLAGPTNVSIDVFESPLQIPTPQGFEAPGTYFVNVALTPEPAYPLTDPGLTLTIPLVSPLPPGSALELFSIDPATGELVPSIGVDGMPVTGTVNPDMLSATFSGIAHFSVVVGLIPESSGPIEVEIDIKPGDFPNSINLGSKGVIAVAILSSAGFDAATVDPLSVTLAGAAVRLKANGQPQSSIVDVNVDGLPDLLLHIGTINLELQPEDTTAVLKGMTFAGDPIQGSDSVRIVP